MHSNQTCQLEHLHQLFRSCTVPDGILHVQLQAWRIHVSGTSIERTIYELLLLCGEMVLAFAERLARKLLQRILVSVFTLMPDYLGRKQNIEFES